MFDKRVVWSVVFLVGAYVLAQAVADVGATKIIQIGGVTMPAGSLMFAITFTLRDLLHKRLGKEWARAAIIAAATFNIIQALYLAWMAQLPYPEFYSSGPAWAMVFAIVPAITIGSIVAEVISETIDTEVYHRWTMGAKTRTLPQWTRVVVSNLISIPVDSLVFSFLAFYLLPPIFGAEPMPFASVLARVASGQVLWKAVVTLVSLPAIYLVPSRPLPGLEPDGSPVGD